VRSASRLGLDALLPLRTVVAKRLIAADPKPQLTFVSRLAT